MASRAGAPTLDQLSPNHVGDPGQVTGSLASAFLLCTMGIKFVQESTRAKTALSGEHVKDTH